MVRLRLPLQQPLSLAPPLSCGQVKNRASNFAAGGAAHQVSSCELDPLKGESALPALPVLLALPALPALPAPYTIVHLHVYTHLALRFYAYTIVYLYASGHALVRSYACTIIRFLVK